MLFYDFCEMPRVFDMLPRFADYRGFADIAEDMPCGAQRRKISVMPLHVPAALRTYAVADVSSPVTAFLMPEGQEPFTQASPRFFVQRPAVWGSREENGHFAAPMCSAWHYLPEGTDSAQVQRSSARRHRLIAGKSPEFRIVNEGHAEHRQDDGSCRW